MDPTMYGPPGQPQGTVGWSGAPVAAPPKKKRTGLLVTIIALAALLVLGGGGFGIYELVQNNHYDHAVSLYNQATTAMGQAQTIDDWTAAQDLFVQARDAFKALGTFKDSASRQTQAAAQVDTCQTNIDYLKAVALFDAADYQGALDAFTALGSFKDSEDYAQKCRDNLDFQAAQAAYDSGDFDTAETGFQRLNDEGFPGADEWLSKTLYAQADKLATSGDYYHAYVLFNNLGSYSDAAARASQCTTPFPATGELYHDPGYSGSIRWIWDASSATSPRFVKIRVDDTVVVTIFLNPGEQTQITLPAGNYGVSIATGDVWFGDTIMFGDPKDGLTANYKTLTFESGLPYETLESGYYYTMQVGITGGNTSGDTTDYGDF